MTKKQTKIFYILIILAMISWGSSWVVAKIATPLAKNEILVFWRFFLGSILLIPLLFILKIPFKFNQKNFFYIFSVSSLMTIYNILYFAGLKKGLASIGGVLVTSLAPLFIFLFFKIKTRDKIRTINKIALCIGFIGSLILIKFWKFDLNEFFLSGNLYFLIAAILWATISILSQSGQEKFSPLTFSFYTYLFVSIFSFFIAFKSNNNFLFIKHNTTFWLSMFYLGLSPTAFAGVIYFIATSKLGADKAGSFIFLVPFNAAFLSFIFLKENIEISTIVGGGLSILSVFLINFYKRKAKNG